MVSLDNNIEEILTRKSDYFEKIYDVIKLLKKYNGISKIKKVPKSDSVAESFRELANEHYRAKNLLTALATYNKCICYAKSDESLSLAYANRSLVYWKLKYYDKCLENIRLAKVAKYPLGRVPILDKRERQCNEMIQKMGPMDQKSQFKPKLSYPPSAGNPAMAEGIKIVVNEEFGRHIVTNRDLNVGDIVMLEQTFDICLRNEFSHKKCANCLIENQLSLIPCPGCTKRMFCSQQCMDIYRENYHKYECPIVDNIFEYDSPVFFSVQLVLRLMHEFGSIEVLNKAWNTKEDSMKVLPCSGARDEATRKKNDLEFFHSLSHGEFKSHQHSYELALIYSWLIEHTDLKNKLSSETDRKNFLNLCCRYCLITSANANTSEELTCEGETGHIDSSHYGYNVTPMMSMLNHSCARNSCQVYYSETMVGLMIVRPVKKGSQLFGNYSADHYQESKVDRHKHLKKYYNFTCRCVACSSDYPLAENLPIAGPYRRLMKNFNTDEEFSQLIRDDNKMAKNMFKLSKNYLQQNDKNYPSQDLFKVRNTLLLVYDIITGRYSMRAKSC